VTKTPLLRLKTLQVIITLGNNKTGQIHLALALPNTVATPTINDFKELQQELDKVVYSSTVQLD
jgi:hypothetical protein